MRLAIVDIVARKSQINDILEINYGVVVTVGVITCRQKREEIVYCRLRRR